ncbi:MAG TPA: carboxyl transferase domain-containing protein [Kofleriaceae bacterium]|jgi:acetyl/propionyl-CoA carboxylase alpha subunit|nr:carboxyl transferase domain-containing protein [Kofleriaceae bacterium]
MLHKLLIANRGEIAIRIAQAAAELGIPTVAIYADEDAHSLHTRRAGTAIALGGAGAPAYLDGARILAIARDTGCDAVHPGVGFLSENAGFARACLAAGLVFVGPEPQALDLFGDKAMAKRFAAGCHAPILPGTQHATSLGEAHAFLRAQGPGGAIMIKASAGGGGRGVRAVTSPEALDEVYARCRSEAQAAFGNPDVYVERLLPRARHIEVQIVGDGQHGVALFERECTVQRRHQKLIEVAPPPSLPGELRAAIVAAACRLAEAASYKSLGTFEFLVELDPAGLPVGFFFLEANPRLQVEHTVTEQVLGLDLVQIQLELAGGRSLSELGLAAGVPPPTGYALQLRINMETMDAQGTAVPASGTLTAFELPFGAGIRVDTFGYPGYQTTTAFDSLLAKLVVHTRGAEFAAVVRKAEAALAQFRIEGVATNLAFLQALLHHPDVIANRVTTRFVEDHAAELVQAAAELVPPLPPPPPGTPGPAPVAGPAGAPRLVPPAPPGTLAIRAPMQSKVVTISVGDGDPVRPGQPVAIVEAMKMEIVVTAGGGGIVRAIAVRPGDIVMPGDPMVFLEPAELAAGAAQEEAAADLDAIRADLAEVRARHAIGLDAARPGAVARRHETGHQTARDNIANLVDPSSFTEYGALALAAQRRRRGVDELIEATPADGLITGTATVNAPLFGPTAARCMVAAYDYTVLAGTQGYMNHKKLDRMLGLAHERRLPVVLFAEGGGGRPGDTDAFGIGLDVPTFAGFARLSGLVPVVGIASGRCFAGNAALLGCCDVIIATADTSIGMGGPAMIEGGGLGRYAPDDVGPARIQAPNGVIDVLVSDERQAALVARQYLSYFQGATDNWQCTDQRVLRRAIPDNRLRAYDVRAVIRDLADTGSVLELRAAFGAGIITALVRIEGRPLGVIANNPHHLGGAIDAPAADKAARFVQLCDAFEVPILALCDTPGFMVGPEAEKTALVRHVSRMFVTSASITVPYATVVLRKAYGLGAIAMAAGDFHGCVFTVAWPTGEFGSMGFEGAVKLGYRKELEAIADPAERRAYYDQMVARYYQEGKAINAASYVEIDEVIDPAETRRWIVSGLTSAPRPERRTRKRPCIDPW